MREALYISSHPRCTQCQLLEPFAYGTPSEKGSSCKISEVTKQNFINIMRAISEGPFQAYKVSDGTSYASDMDTPHGFWIIHASRTKECVLRFKSESGVL